MKSLIILFLFSGIVLPGCYYDVEEELYPPTTSCDTSSVTYTSTIVTLLQSNGCLGCHSGAAPSGNIILEGYNNLRAVAQTGKLYGAISHSAGFSPMPQGGNKMSACAITKIKSWIDAGAPNN